MAEKTVTFDDAQWVLVPREPTEAMLHAAELDDIDSPGVDDWRDHWRLAWKSMLAAAPISRGGAP